MSFCIRIFRLDLARLRELVGSHDRRLVAALQPRLQDVYEEVEEDEDDEEDLVTPVDALQQIVAGEVPDDDWGGEPYREALFALYEHLGSQVDDWLLSSHDHHHLQEVETALQNAGARPPLSLFSLIYRGAPLRVPDGEEPAIGYLESSEVAEAHAVYDELSLAQVPSGLRASVERIGAWLRAGTESRWGSSASCSRSDGGAQQGRKLTQP
jgi:hypothetical protein